MLSIASINPTIEDFIADKELLSDYESTCKGVNPFNASSYPSACENWAKANQKIFLSKKKTNYTYEKKINPNEERVISDIALYLKDSCSYTVQEANEKAESSMRKKMLVITLERRGETEYNNRLSRMKCSDFKALF